MYTVTGAGSRAVPRTEDFLVSVVFVHCRVLILAIFIIFLAFHKVLE